MRLTRYYMPTLREKPAEAEILSHQLMLRGGMIRKLASGIYSFLPLGYRVVRKVEEIIRQEMNAKGALEVFLPAVQPAELWKETGRWDRFGKELLRFKDRGEREFCLGPTHEEVITDLVRNELRSYRQLPVNLYQIHMKFRDEIRPRFGLMRAREFIMKDAYSFDADEEGLGRSYQDMYEAYSRIFTRCGLRFTAVEADTGAIGGDVSHEFMVWAETGEDVIVRCSQCGYAANLEKAEFQPSGEGVGEDEKPLEKVHTPDVTTVEEVTGFLGVSPSRLVKTLLYRAEKGFVALMIPGDREVNEIKVLRLLGVEELELTAFVHVEEITGAPVGFAGPIGLERVKLVADRTLEGMRNVIVGANEEDYHFVNANPGRDFSWDVVGDIVKARPGDGCHRCGAALEFSKGIEVGHIFKLGTKYSGAMGARFLDEKGQEHPFVMGCYGIGVTRTVASAIEQTHDGNGIIWPISIAPYECYLLPTNTVRNDIKESAERIYRGLLDKGVEVLLDDRDERAGVKFKDADLIGVPMRVTLGERGIKEGLCEVKLRREERVREVSIGKVVEEVVSVKDVLLREVAV
jgi:prolyl-tRNA synthetase